MKLDLSEIAATIGMQQHYVINEPPVEADDIRTLEPIKGKVEFTNAGNHIIARGGFKTKVAIECGRCLEDFTLPIDVKIEEELPILNVEEQAEGVIEEIPILEQEPLFENNIFDLSEYIRQIILVQIPMLPICRETCAGLCPTCGTNLNEGTCDCPLDVSASPFSVLQEILEDEIKSEDVE